MKQRDKEEEKYTKFSGKNNYGKAVNKRLHLLFCFQA